MPSPNLEGQATSLSADPRPKAARHGWPCHRQLQCRQHASCTQCSTAANSGARVALLAHNPAPSGSHAESETVVHCIRRQLRYWSCISTQPAAERVTLLTSVKPSAEPLRKDAARPAELHIQTLYILLTAHPICLYSATHIPDPSICL